MLQTVPSALHNSDSFAAYAENFDLSLLPSMDGDCDAIDVQSQFLSQNLMYSNININNSVDIKPSFQRSISPDDYIPTTITSTLFDNNTKKINQIVGGQQHHSIAHSGISQQEYHQTDLLAYNNIGGLPLSPPQDQFITIFPPSPSPSIEYNNNNHLNHLMIKQEYITSTTPKTFGLYPPSPPDSNGAPSPIGHLMIGDIKTEPYEIGPEPCLDLSTFFGNQFVDNLETTTVSNTEHTSSASISASASSSASLSLSSISMSTLSSTVEQRKDHQLLREYLQDTTFQRKHNLKPLALESLFIGDAWGARNDIEPVISLALEHARKDIHDTCLTLNISAGKSLYLTT